MENVSTVDSGAKTETPLQQNIDATLPPSTPLALAVESVQRKRGRTGKSPSAIPVETIKPAVASVRILSDAEKQLARETVRALTHTLDFVALVYMGGVANECGLSQDETKRLNDRVKMSDQMRDGMTTSGVAVAEKYGVASSLPEIALGGYLLAYVGGLVATARELKSEFKPKPGLTSPERSPRKGEPHAGK